MLLKDYRKVENRVKISIARKLLTDVIPNKALSKEDLDSICIKLIKAEDLLGTQISKQEHEDS